MKIGIDASSIPPFVAGAGRYICGLVTALARVDSSNEYFVFAKHKDLHLFDSVGENFTKVGLTNFDRPQRIAWQLFQPRKLIQRYNLDVWHAPHYILPKNLTKVHSVVTFHDMTFFLFPQFYSRHKQWFFKNVIRDSVKRADTIVAVSKTTEHDIQRLFRNRTDGLIHVYSGTNGEFKPNPDNRTPSEIKSKLKIRDRFILFVGTLEKRKNVTALIRAFSQLHQDGFSDLKLIVAGQRENAYNDILGTIAAMGLHDRVVLLGYVPEEELPALYSAATLFVYPSRYEGFGFPVLEAMASGTPTLTSNNSAMREIAATTEALVDPENVEQLAERIKRVLTDEPFRRKIIRHGLKRAQELTWEKTASQMVKIYAGNIAVGYLPDVPFPVPAIEKDRPESTEKADVTTTLLAEASLSDAVLRTVIYSDLFDYPLTSAEIHRDLVGHKASQKDVEESLLSQQLATFIEHQDGLFFLKGKKKSLQNRAQREAVSLGMLRRHRRLLKFVCQFPFVKGAALSGAVAFKNCVPGDDIDLFLIVDTRRVWTVYFLLAAILKLLGKRTLICVNYMFGKADLKVDTQNFFVAHQIAHLRPLSGNGVFQDFFDANGWVLQYLPQASKQDLECSAAEMASLMKNDSGPTWRAFRTRFEKVLSHRFFDTLERWIFNIYAQHIRNITRGQRGSISVERDQIRLFTNDHRSRVLQKFQERLNQVKELHVEL